MKFKLRQKIFLHFLIFMAVNSAIWLFSYYSNSAINHKLRIIERKKDLLDTMLEARRYEKNFFLRKNIEDLVQALSYVDIIEEKQSYIESHLSGFLEDAPAVHKRTGMIRDYKKNLRQLYDAYEAEGKTAGEVVDTQEISRIQEEVTNLGRRLTTDIEAVEKKERQKVFDLLNKSRMYLVVSLFALLLLTFLTAFFLIMNVNRPLKAIEASVQKVVSGDVNKIPRLVTGDEFEALADSLNEMLIELGRRKDQLVQAEKMSSLGTLTSGVAHELNNPLNNISTSIQIIREELEEPDIEFKRNLLVQAEQQIDRARDIIRALLEFSRQREFTTETVVFRNLVQSTMHLISGEVPADIEMVIDVPGDLEGTMDPRRIQQVLLNLIINAVHAMEEEGGKLGIAARQDKETGEFVFQVSDSGSGISKENIARIFDPFFTTKEVGKGSGLGLSIIHGIIEQHGGTIDVASTPEQGTVFEVRLPA